MWSTRGVSRFTAPLLVTPLDDGKTWIIVSDDFEYHVGAEGSPDRIVVPQWMGTDFASVPRPVWWLIAPWGTHGHAAVVHDAGYFRQEPDRSRRWYDRAFLEAMEVLEVPPARRRLMYAAVRAFGWFSWRSNARRKAQDPNWKIHDPVELGLPADGEDAVRVLARARDRAPNVDQLRRRIETQRADPGP